MIEIIVGILVGFWGTRRALPHSIRKLRENNYLAKDMYKVGKPQVPTNGGIIVLFVSYITVSLLPLAIRLINQIDISAFESTDFNELSLALLLVVSIYGLYGHF